ncbi:MAG: hypothetical protein MUC87_09155 [Bacteroidia bacterium]|jgi:hypothetical protein|nr:hypothetical protein [Bacteroidia bacterium]
MPRFIFILLILLPNFICSQNIYTTFCGKAPLPFHLTADSLKSLGNQPDSLLDIYRLKWRQNSFLELRKYPQTCSASLTHFIQVCTRPNDPKTTNYWISKTHHLNADTSRKLLRVIELLKFIPHEKELKQPQNVFATVSLKAEMNCNGFYCLKQWSDPQIWPDSLEHKKTLLAVLDYLSQISARSEESFIKYLPRGRYCGEVIPYVVKTGSRKTGYYEKRRLNGQIRVQGFYQHGEKTGEWCFYDRDGRLRSQGLMINGVREGVWYLTDVNDEVHLDGTKYLHGKVIGRMTMSW